jgi:peptidoglycan/xylan/chitin deacetylase (PgdA/CDA1 family)
MLAEFGVIPESKRTAGPDQTISWENVREMSASGAVSFGSHTARHEILTTVGPETVRKELEEGRFGVEQALGMPCLTLAYPNGNWNPEIARIARESGYRRAFAVERAPWTLESDPYAIPRCNMAQADMVGPLGNFSRAMFLYTSVWKAYRAMKHAAKPAVPTPGTGRGWPATGDFS